MPCNVMVIYVSNADLERNSSLALVEQATSELDLDRDTV